MVDIYDFNLFDLTDDAELVNYIMQDEDLLYIFEEIFDGIFDLI